MEQPFFSIGVTTYKRPVLLREALHSILQQGFTDYEVLVGNDDPEEPLALERLGIDDPRVRIINQPMNLGEMRNMNALLAAARSRYFTWLADDDLYARRFLERIHGTLVRHGFPPCVFTSYVKGARYDDDEEHGVGTGERLLSGREFLREYLARSLDVLGCYGMFDIGRLRANGGTEQLGEGFSPYNDVLLAIKAARLERIVYLDEPLILFRIHDGSISWTSTDISAYRTAQASLLKRALTILESADVRDDLHRNMRALLEWCVGDFVCVAHRGRSVSMGELLKYVGGLSRSIAVLRGSDFFWPMIRLVLRTSRDLSKLIARRRLAGGARAGKHAGVVTAAGEPGTVRSQGRGGE